MRRSNVAGTVPRRILAAMPSPAKQWHGPVTVGQDARRACAEGQTLVAGSLAPRAEPSGLPLAGAAAGRANLLLEHFGTRRVNCSLCGVVGGRHRWYCVHVER